MISTNTELWGPRGPPRLHLKQEALKNVGPIRHNEPPHAHSADVASGTVACHLRIDVHDIDNDDDENDNAWQRGPLWPHGMGPINDILQQCLHLKVEQI